MPKKILIITTNFYPKHSSGTLRINAFCRSFLKAGYRIDILTGNLGNTNNKPPDFLEDPYVRVFRTPAPDTKKWSLRGRQPAVLGIPDRYWPWFFASIPVIKKLAKESYHFMLSSSPVQTAHLIAFKFKSLTDVPWICDFRDPWLWGKKIENRPAYQLIIEKWLEKKVVTRADVVTVTNNNFNEFLYQEYKRAVHTIANGFTPEDFEGLSPAETDKKKKTFIHAGSLYGRFRDPTHLLEAVSVLKKMGKISADTFSLEFIGGGTRLYQSGFNQQLQYLDITDLIVVTDKLPHDQTLQRLMSSDCLVLLQCDPDLLYQVPAKLYEYLRCKKPILGLVAKGATDDILQTINPNWSVHPKDQKGIQQFVEKIVNTDDTIYALPTPETITGYSRDIQAGKLVVLAREF